ncbi:hypothetical protein [Paenibacillus endoradicis]|uniref:hypothetical protein n=1 Tax=Paenibacillus endoradicis TaxID=2972487 RepID=UPI002159585D|nr:hypothetical protein [Paenibacillus endoradicis]MCR8658891.1 hypothetical protein [Paenibacillus endoradicis]
MTHFLRQGWRMAKGHTKIVFALFIYHAIWGFVLYKMIDNIITPLLKRYPELTGSADTVALFWMENQFKILKTDVWMPYLYTFLILLLIRMIFTPLLQAGLFYSIHHRSEVGKGTYFRKGIAEKWKQVTLLYWIKNILLFIPMIWIIKPFLTNLFSNKSITAIFSFFDWTLFMYIVWALIIQLLFYVLQLGTAWEMSKATILRQTLVNLLPFIVVSLVIAFFYSFFSVSIHALSIIWVSFLSFLLYQILPLIRMLFKVWMISSQYESIREHKS